MNDRQPGPVTCGAVAAVDLGGQSGRVVLGRVGLAERLQRRGKRAVAANCLVIASQGVIA